MHLVEPVPDRTMVVEVEAAREGDLWAGRKQGLDLGAALGGDEIAAVDHRSREGTLVDHRPGTGPPGRAGFAPELFGRLVAEGLHAVAALDEREPL